MTVRDSISNFCDVLSLIKTAFLSPCQRKLENLCVKDLSDQCCLLAHWPPLSPLLLMRGNNSRLKLGHSLGAGACCQLRVATVISAKSRLCRPRPRPPLVATHKPLSIAVMSRPPPPSAVSYLICGSEQ